MAAQIELAGVLSFRSRRNWKKSVTRQGIITRCIARRVFTGSPLWREDGEMIRCRKGAEFSLERLSPGRE